mmetsp:Transcript_18565/g.26123  ORF Transcript_18565/g.26123 Transcript_18565/m.26123 type:complete len:212 (+) Transcript_18565:71-706(+)
MSIIKFIILHVALTLLFADASTTFEPVIEDFSNPKHSWDVLNDTLMGGQSSGTLSITNGVADFKGSVSTVSFLHGPGFVSIVTHGGVYPDMSTCNALKLNLMVTQEYSGLRISLGSVNIKGKRHSIGYRSKIDAPVGSFTDIIIPFADFTVKSVKDEDRTVITCKENDEYCLSEGILGSIKTLSIWGEGVEGNFHLRIKSISATNCSDNTN